MNKPWGRIMTDILQLPAGSLSLTGISYGTRRTGTFLIQRAAGGLIAERFFAVSPCKTFLACKEVPLHDVCIAHHYTCWRSLHDFCEAFTAL